MDHIVNNPMRENNQGLDIKEEHAQPDENVDMFNNELIENNSEIKNENIPENDAKDENSDEKLEDIPGFTCENVDSEPNDLSPGMNISHENRNFSKIDYIISKLFRILKKSEDRLQ